MKARPFSFVSHYDAAWVVLVALTFMLALVIVPVAADSFVMPKETLVAVGCVLGAALVAGWTLLGNGKLSLALKPLNGAVLVWVLWHWLSVIWADARVMAVESATRTSLYVGIFFLLQLVAGGYRSRMAWLLGAVAGSSLVLSIWTVFQDARAAWFPGSVPVRAVLGDWRDALSQVGLGNTSHLGDALVLGFLCWVAALLVVRRGWVRWAVVASLALHAAALIVTWSVHSNVSLVLAGGLLVFLLWGARPLVGLVRGRRLWLGALVGCWAAVVLFFTVDHPLNPHGSAVWAQEDSQRGGIFSQAFSSSRWTSGLDTRKAIWLTTLEIVRLNPWLGTGAGTFTWVYPATISELVRNDAKLASWSGSWTNAAHQEVLQVWSELGIVGAALLVVLVAISLRSSWERLRGGASGTTAVMLAVGMAAWALRYGLFAGAAKDQVFWMAALGVALHGICYDFFIVTGQIYVDRRAPSRVRGQAQGFLVLITQGLGMLVGAQAFGKLVTHFTTGPKDAQVIDWKMVWLVPAGFAAHIMLVFIAFFKDKQATDAKASA